MWVMMIVFAVIFLALLIVLFVIVSLITKNSKTTSYSNRSIYRTSETNFEYEKFFFQHEGAKGKQHYFFCDAPTLGVKIPADQMILVDVEEVYNYVFRMFENTEENFFGLEKDGLILQFSHSGKGKEVVVDIPAISEGGSYQALVHSIQQIEELVDAFYNDLDVFTYADFELMIF